MSTLQRIERDFYKTHEWLTVELLKEVEVEGLIFEPCAGDGEIVKALIKHSEFDEIWSNDINPDFSCNSNLDMTLTESWGRIAMQLVQPADWVVTNPPFSEAHKILPLAWENCHQGVAFLLRLSYLEPCKNRAKWLQDHARDMSDLIVFNPRPKFRNDTTNCDNVTVAWFVWRKNWGEGLRHGVTHVSDWGKD
jgi:hypothetical protein